jgi:GNAT superfamily N-acetyltransferase
VRGKTRENAFSEEQLRSIGTTAQSWADDIRFGALPCHVCTAEGHIVGYCFGPRDTGEIRVLVVLPEFENSGIGRKLLQRTTTSLAEYGHRRLFLGCSPTPTSSSHGFYRHPGWRSTGTYDRYGDEILGIFVEP